MNKASPLPLKIILRKNIGKLSGRFYETSGGKKNIRVLVYHNITNRYVSEEWAQMTTPRDLFDKHMRYLKENDYNIVNAEQVIKILVSDVDIPSKTVCITFDDGYKDNYINACPILEKYGLKGTIFVTANSVGRKGKFGEYLSWDEIKEMDRKAVFTFGCHSFSHKNLAGLKDEELDRETGAAKNILEDKLNKKVETFAYPFGWPGAFNRRVADMLKRKGFSCAFTGVHGANTKKTDIFRLRRIRVSWLDEIDEFQKILRGSYDWYCMYQRTISIWKKPS